RFGHRVCQGKQPTGRIPIATGARGSVTTLLKETSMSWLPSLRSQPFGPLTRRRSLNRPPRGKKLFARLTLERLEDRLVLSANMVPDLNPYTQGPSPNNIPSAAKTPFFTATTSSGNIELFKSDGTAAGTVQLTSGSQLINFVN